MEWALAWGCTVRELLSRVSSTDITRMEAFNSIAPIGGQRQDCNTAWLVAHMLLCWTDAKRVDVADYLPFKNRPSEPQTGAAQRAMFKQLTHMLGGEVSG